LAAVRRNIFPGFNMIFEKEEEEEEETLKAWL
jgi:hypothetical protein